MSTKSSAISCCFGITSRFSVSKPKQGNPNPLKIFSSTFHSPNHKSHLKPSRFSDIKNLDEALTLFNHMLEMKPMSSSYDYSRLFSIIINMECYEQVIVLFKKLIVLGLPCDEYMMNPLIDCYCKLREVKLGFAVVACFLKMGYSPSVVSFNCLIKGFFLEENLGEAVGLFKKLVRDERYEISEFTISTVLNGLVKLGHVAEAVELLQISEARKWKLDVVSYSSVMYGLCKIGMVKDGIGVLCRMMARGILPDVVSYSTVLDGLCKVGMVEDGMALMFRMIDDGIPPNVVTYNILIHGLCNLKQLDSARTIFNDLPSKGICPNVITYTVMIQGLCRNGMFEDAKKLLEKMELDGCFPDGVTYNVIIQACLHHLDSSDSVRLLGEIAEKDFQLDAPSFFVLLRRMEVTRQMGNYDDAVIDNLIRKLVTSDAVHLIQDNYDGLAISSLIQKLISSDRRCISI